MADFMERAKELRADTTRHYNCAQSVLIPFAEAKGYTTEQAYSIGRNFGTGMKMGGTCGAITGGLMALGMYDVDDAVTIGNYFRTLREHHDGLMDCANLLRVNTEQGGQRKPHCDGMVFECVELVEKILKEQRKI
jgi:C_GCAxxG_C_C family probable redox protein